MKNLGFNELRTLYLDFFESKGHVRLKSYSLVPKDDDSLLLINAGMAPLKKYFMGEKKMEKNRATSSQRCVRTGDINNVGKTARHATFFEMLGNFSFGDYFKKEAIHWAWEFLTEVLGMEKDRLWISVYNEDDQAYNIWVDQIGVDPSHMLRLGKEDNFWELDQGPCGPCSEIHYDRGPEYGEGSGPLDNSDRFMEIWNLVFTQFDRQPDGTTYIPLKKGNIDTGMGLERLALVSENKDNIFELEEFMPLRDYIEELSGKKYGEKSKWDESFRIIIDHSKATLFLISDGVIPSNEGRGYVLRRLIRRAYRHGKLLGIDGEFLTKTMNKIIPVYIGEYPELGQAKDRIFKIVSKEEENFQATIDQGLEMLEDKLNELLDQGKNTLSGSDAFRLYDTFGFPLDLTKEICEEKGLGVDEEGFNEKMEIQRELSRKGRKGGVGWDEKKTLNLTAYPATEFSGYEKLEDKAQILGIFVDYNEKEELDEGQEGVVIFDRSPLYAESGGQTADRGQIIGDDGSAFVYDVQKDKDDHYLHLVKLEKGKLQKGQEVELRVDSDRRNDTMCNHSATHLLHKALSLVLGDHVKQSGSYVDPERLRFDFSHFEAMTEEEIDRVEDLVNRAIYDSYPVTTEIMPLDQALKTGAESEFEDRYKNEVRVVSMGDFSKELCGGTHVKNTSRIGSFRILSEQAVSSGVRRIEAVTGRKAYQLYKDEAGLIKDLARMLKSDKKQVLSKIKGLLKENKELKKDVETYESKLAMQLSDKLGDRAEEICGVKLIKQRLDGKSMDELKDLADAIKSNNKDFAAVLVSNFNSKVFWVVSLADSVTEKGGNAGKLVKDLAQMTGGNGGGKKNFATAGGKDPQRIDEALDKVASLFEAQIN